MKKMKLRTWVKVAIILILLAAIGVLATPVFNLYEIEFDLGGQEKVVWEYGVPYEDAPVTCYRKAILMPTYKEELQFDKSDNIDVNKLGVYQVVYHGRRPDIRPACLHQYYRSYQTEVLPYRSASGWPYGNR